MANITGSFNAFVAQHPMQITWDEDYWAVTFPDTPGLVAGAKTWEELLPKVRDAWEAWCTS